MPWRVKTLTEYRTSEGASPEGIDNMPVSDDLSLSVAEQLGDVETSDFLSGGCALNDSACGDGEPGRTGCAIGFNHRSKSWSGTIGFQGLCGFGIGCKSGAKRAGNFGIQFLSKCCHMHTWQQGVS